MVDQTQTLYGHQIHGLPVILFSAEKLFMGGVQVIDVFHFSGLLFHLVKFLHGCYIHYKDFVWLLHTFTRPPAKCFSDLGICLWKIIDTFLESSLILKRDCFHTFMVKCSLIHVFIYHLW